MSSDSAAADTLRRNALGAPHIVCFVVAAAAPLTAVIGVTPAAFMLGNGPGVPVTFILVGGLYLLFSAGFTAMSGFVSVPVASTPISRRALARRLAWRER